MGFPLSDSAPWLGPIQWTALKSWYPQLTTLLETLLQSGAIPKLKRMTSHGLYDDDPLWFEQVIDLFSGDEDDLLAQVSLAIAGLRLRAYHGTRTADASSFLREGIRLHVRAQLEAEVRALVVTDKELSFISKRLDGAFERAAHLIEEGRCYVVVDQRVLIEQCGHYLLGGSEFIQGIIGPDAARLALREAAPTILEINLPLARVKESFLRNFARVLLQEWAKITCKGLTQPRYLDFTFVLQEPVPPDWIAGHFHPPVVNDPHSLRRPVRTEQVYCAACTPMGHTSKDNKNPMSGDFGANDPTFASASEPR